MIPAAHQLGVPDGRAPSLRQQDGGAGDGGLVFHLGARREGVAAEGRGGRRFPGRLREEAAPVGRRDGLVDNGVSVFAELDEVSCHGLSLGLRGRDPVRIGRGRARWRLVFGRVGAMF